MFLGILSPSNANAAVPTDLEIQIAPSSNIDIVLSLGKTSLNVPNFEADIKTALLNKGIAKNKVKVQAVETVEQDVQNSFSWNQDIYSSVGSINFQNNGTKIEMKGNPSNVGFNKIYTSNNSDPGIKEQEMGFSFALNYGDSFDGAGVLLNTHVVNGSMNGYLLVFPKDTNKQATLYKINNWLSGDELYSGGHSASGTVNSKATYIGKYNLGQSGNFNLKTTKDKLTIKKNGSEVGTLNLPNHYGWGFGFFSDHYSHGCSDIGKFSLENVQLDITKGKEFTEVIRMPEWRENSKRLLVNIEDFLVNDFDNTSALGEILPRLSNENIHYIAWGTSTNKAQAEKIIKMNNNNGAFYMNNNYSAAVELTAQYIKNLLAVDNTNSQNVLLGEPVDISVLPANLMKNTQTTEYPLGRWKIDHDFEFYDNNMGQASWANQFQKDLLMVFDKPGRYEIFFEDQNPEPRYIYAHRRPISNYSLIVKSVGSNFNIAVQDYSYDPDREYSDSNKGIVASEWKWREVTAVDWTNGKIPGTLPIGKDYIVQLRVQDEYGVWSIPEQRYITTNSVVANPISNFNISPNPVSKYDTLEYDNTSYDPAGRSLIDSLWTVRKDGNVVYQSSSPKKSFLDLGEGNYIISLKVKNDANLWSQEFNRPLNVTKDIDAPESIINPTDKDWVKNVYDINITYSDKGKSGFKHQRYALTNSFNFPTSGFSSWDPSLVRNVSVNQDGIYYLHIEAFDNEGNRLTRTSGPYKLDKTNPNKPNINLSTTDWAASGVNFTLTDNGDTVNGSGVDKLEYMIVGKNNQWMAYLGGSITIPSDLKGLIDIKARTVDKVGNISTVDTAQAKIDDVAPTISDVSVITQGTNKLLKVVAFDNESGLADKAYQYNRKTIGYDSSFVKDPSDWSSDNPLLLPITPANAKYIYNVIVRDKNNNTSKSKDVVYVSAPVIDFSGIKDGDFENTVTINLRDAVKTSGEVKVEVKRGNSLVGILESGSEFKDENLDYERTYSYTLTAYTTHLGDTVASLPVKVDVSIGSPKLEITSNGDTFYVTPFSKDYEITGDVRYRQGGELNFDLMKGSTKISGYSLKINPYETSIWRLKGNLGSEDSDNLSIVTSLKGKEDLFNSEINVTVTKKDISKILLDTNKYKDVYKK
jgi:hypothetical protein